MRQLISILAFVVVALAVSGCDQEPSAISTGTGQTVDITAESSVDGADLQKAPKQTAAQRDAERHKLLSMRLTALDFFAEQMWPSHDHEAGFNWLRNSAAGSGLKLTEITAEDDIERDGVTIRPLTLQAMGNWADVVSWLQAIEASQRRLVLRKVDLNTRRDGVRADLEIAVLIDQPTGLMRLTEMDVAELSGEALDHAVRIIEADLKGKSQALNELGADASWSRPIAELTEWMPDAARPVTLSLTRTGNGERAREFSGRFVLVVSDAGQVPGYIRQLQKQPGFAAAGLQSLRRAGAGWQRAVVTFTFTGVDALPDPMNNPSSMARAATKAP
ncbi:MAG: hypothetical protein AAGH99_00575 [Planctomycetota bacterium]